MTMVLVSAALGGTAVWIAEWGFAVQKDRVGASHRQEIYQSILDSYSATMKSGMTRAQVEDGLRMRGVKFSSIGLDEGASNAEITKIGFETGPWYCTGFDFYVAFHFTGPPGSEDSSETLRKISIESLPVDCL